MRLFIIEHTQNAIHSLRSTKMRTLLTTLGVTIGVASITTILSLSSGITQVVSKQVGALGGNIAVVRPGAPTLDFEGFVSPTIEQTYTTSTLTEQDLIDIEALDSVDSAAPLMIVNGSVKSESATAKKSTILATTPSLVSIANLPISDGQFIDSVTNKDTAVIGSQLSIDLFGTNQSIGQTFKIRGQTFTVIGILKSMNDPINFNSVDFDQTAIISLESGKGFHQGIAQIQQINVRAKDTGSLPQMKNDIDAKLLKNHLDERDFSILTGEQISEPSNRFFRGLTGVMTVIAGISLIVGGIGIMNIMLVGVAERTREIGLRKSVGASNSNIVWQFLMESLIISIVGGLIGYAAGYIVAFALSTLLTFNPAFTWEVAGAALGTSLGVGILFGIYPALRAARKDPIESLRHFR
ncbi:MAG: ABC transporter permease [Candidatus Saccharibacteria bacterium]|nr:MAG: ABC transporter permease [Candidatus Saccharibacteria bacterium]